MSIPLAAQGVAGAGAAAGLTPLAIVNPVGTIAGSMLGASIPSLAGSGKTAWSSSGDIADRSVINVSPVAVNLGEILRNFNEGSPPNGGFGINGPSRYMPVKSFSEDTFRSPDKMSIQHWPWLAIAAGAGLLLAFMIK